MSSDAVEEDLARHFANQLRQLLADSGDTFACADTPVKVTASYLIAGLLREASLGMMSLGISEGLYADLCVQAYRDTLEKLPQDKKDRLTRLSRRHRTRAATTEPSDDQGTERQPRRPPRR